MSNIVIHNNNVDLPLFEDDINFDSSDDMDGYISKEIISKIQKKDLDVIYIKDNLSTNYMELLGLRVAYHIRLSQELGDKRFLPIVILSDLDSYILNKIDSMAKILFTKNIYIIKNTEEEIVNIKKKNFQNLSKLDYQEKFLNLIEVEPPKDYLSHHDIANEWSIFRWAELLEADSEAIKKNKAKIEDMLYFKYLKAKYQVSSTNKVNKIHRLSEKGKVLFIDDEWDKGWSDNLAKIFTLNEKINFKTFEYDYKDKSELNLYFKIKNIINEFDPDVVILDLRLSENDHNKNRSADDFLGIDILKKIHEVNAGIQVIMLTATSKSSTLEKLYEKKILGYIKKEHPDDLSIDTVENINKLVKLVNKGLKREYLKKIFNIQNEIINLMDIDINHPKENLEIFEKFDNINKKKYLPKAIKVYKESLQVFNLLDSNNTNRFIYAMISIISAIESILQIFIDERREIFWDGQQYNCQYNALRCRIKQLFEVKFNSNIDYDLKELIDIRNDYLHSLKNVTIEPKQIKSWFIKLRGMIKIINEYDRNNILKNMQNTFNNK